MPRVIQRFQTPEFLLMLMASAVPLSFSTWSALINNFAHDEVLFNGAQFGILQSIREVPGFLAFLVIFVLILLREQYLAVISLLVLGLGTALTGYFPTVVGLYCTTVIMSVGYHYYETIQNSLSLQWIEKDRTPLVLGKLLAVGSFTSLLAYSLTYVGLKVFDFDYASVFLIAGGATIVIAITAAISYPFYSTKTAQTKKIVLRKRYWLYYALVFLSGARRQIFMVFAGFMMVEKFGYGPDELILLFLINCGINIWLAPLFGKLVAKWGERKALKLEYSGLVIVFVSYAFVENAQIAALLYVIDHIFFGLAIAIKTYFQKIADRADIASTAGVSFTINHIVAVILPALLGVVWLTSPSTVFLCGAGFAVLSLILSLLVPDHPENGNETRFPHKSSGLKTQIQSANN